MVVLGAGAVVIGLVLLVLPSDQASFGWFAFEPLPTTVFSPPGVLLTPQSHIGVVLLMVGLAMFGFGAGWVLGQRQAAGQRRLLESGNPDA